jgi:hypothetical protein
MSATAAANPVAVLRRAALLFALLAVITGFLGMHILSGFHGPHAQPSRHGSIQTSTATHAAGQAASGKTAGHPAGHSSHSADGTTPQTYDRPAAAATASAVTADAVTVGGTQVPPTCTCQGGCAQAPAVHVGCTPSPAAASVGAPLPGTTPAEVQPWTAARANRPSGYDYLPGTPTPRDLSISRT